MSRFSTKNIEVTASSDNYIRPGVQEVKIVEVEGVEPESGSPYINVTLVKDGVDPEVGKRSYRLFMTDNSIEKSLEKLTNMGMAVVKRADFDAASEGAGESIVEYGKNLNKILRNKNLRMKFKGVEYKDPNGNVKTRTDIPLRYFAEAVNEGAELEATPVTRMKFDPTNKYDLERLQSEAPSNTVEGMPGGADDDLPF